MQKYEKKLTDLIKYSTLTFQTNNDVHINARKSAEALCKLMIFKSYGDEKGTALIYNKDSYLISLHKLIKICTQESILTPCYNQTYKGTELSNVLRNSKTYLESILYALNYRGNHEAHDSHIRPLHAETTQNLLRELLEWLFQDFLKIDIPSALLCYIGTYDIFISYQEEDEAWVKTLKTNFLNHGYKVFDNNQLIMGENRKKSIRTAIKHAYNAIEIYPKERTSKWMNNESEWIKEQKEQDNDFKSIPIVIHKSQNLPPENIRYTDFSNQAYENAFNQILSGLKRVPSNKNHIEHELELPKTANQFVDEVIQDLEEEKVVILFSQEFSDIKKYYTLIEEQLQLKFSKNFYKISIPSFKQKKYFHFIAESCAIDEKVESLQEWKTAMQKKLSKAEPTLLFITDLNDGRESCNKKFASTLRNLCYQFSTNLYVVLVGHKELAELVFQEGDLSPLRSIGKHLFFPYNHENISYEDIKLIISQPIIEEQKEYLSKLLETKVVQRYTPWSYEELINYLFWKGLLIRENKYIVWRSQEVQEMIKELISKKTNL